MSLLIILDHRGKIEGTQIHALEICKELNKQKKKYLLVYNKKNKFYKIAKKKKINISYLNFLPSSPKNIFRVFQIFKIKENIKKILSNNKVKNILIYNSYLNVFLPRNITSQIYCFNHAGFSNFNSLKIFTLTNLFSLKNLLYAIYNKYFYYNYSGIHKVLCTSTEAINKMKNYFKIKKYVKVDNGICLKKKIKKSFLINKVKKKNKIILSVGRFSETKGILDFCKVAYQMHKYKNIKFCYIAPSDNKFKKFELQTKIKYKKYVTFLKNMSNENVLKFMKNSYIFLFLSHRESSSLSCIESMSRGTPIIVWKDKGNNDIIKTNINGYKIKFHNFANVKNKIKFLLNNPKTYLNLASSTVIFSQKFNISKTVNYLYSKVFE